MFYQTLDAKKFAPELHECNATLTAFCRSDIHSLADRDGRWAVIICPGGGYETIADTEAEPVALAFLAAGIQAFVLRYSVFPATYPQQLRELACAVQWVHTHAVEYGICQTAVCGFSAGGHLVGCLANRWNGQNLADLGEDISLRRPEAAIMCYPVISSHSSKKSKIPADTDSHQSEFAYLDLDTDVNAKNPPTFLWCTVSDQMVSMENTLAYAAALRRASVPFELHIFPSGPHAMSTATPESALSPHYADPHVAHWLPLCLEWLDTLKEEKS